MEGILYYIIFWLLKTIVTIAERIIDLLTGWSLFHGSVEERKKSEIFGHSAHVMTVIAKGRYSSIVTHTDSHFFCQHKEYVNPIKILERKDIFMFGVTQAHAMFAVIDPTVNLYNTTEHPFIFMDFFNHTKELILLPLKHAHHLADKAGDPKVKVCLVGMTARCGSTLIAQAVNRVPRTRVMCEPWTFTNLHRMRKEGAITEEENKRILKTIMRLMCKVEPGSDIDAILIKCAGFVGPQINIVKEIMPDCALLFSTRHPKKSMESYMKLFLHENDNGLSSKLFQGWYMNHIVCPYENPDVCGLIV